jgi:predicted nucleic acid-binding protein
MKIAANRYSKQDIANLTDKAVFFDANVVIYIFWPLSPGPQYYTQQYSNILSLLIKQGNSLKINKIVLSEVINRIARFEYNKYLDTNNVSIHFKVFRDTQEGQNALQDIYNIIKNDILDKFTLSEKSFSVDDIKSLLQVDALDFNDKLIIAECKENGYLLLTNDADYKDVDIDVLTVNKKILDIPQDV